MAFELFTMCAGRAAHDRRTVVRVLNTNYVCLAQSGLLTADERLRYKKFAESQTSLTRLNTIGQGGAILLLENIGQINPKCVALGRLEDRSLDNKSRTIFRNVDSKIRSASRRMCDFNQSNTSSTFLGLF